MFCGLVPPVRVSCHVTIAPPAPSGAIWGFSWQHYEMQIATPFVSQPGEIVPFDSTRCAKKK